MTDDVDQAEALVKRILGGVVVLQSETPIYDELLKAGRWKIQSAGHEHFWEQHRKFGGTVVTRCLLCYAYEGDDVA